jgi:hypothetical protein
MCRRINDTRVVLVMRLQLNRIRLSGNLER